MVKVYTSFPLVSVYPWIGISWSASKTDDRFYFSIHLLSKFWRGWSGGAMVLGKLPVLGRPKIWLTVGQGPNALAVGAGVGCLDIFTLICSFSSLSPSLLGDGPT